MTPDEAVRILIVENKDQAERIKKLKKEQVEPKPMFLGLLDEFYLVVNEAVPSGQIWVASHEQLSEILDCSIKQFEKSIKAQAERIEKLCDHCGTHLVQHEHCCIHCGAPQCCPLCCAQEHIDAQQQEIERLKNTQAYERRLDSSVRDQNARTYAKNKLLTAEKQAQARRIKELEEALREEQRPELF